MSNIVTTAIKYFTENELKCKGTGVIKLDKRFADALVKLRESFKEQMIPSSVCRTPAHNKAVGGHPRSLHLTENPVRPTNGTMAADIMWRSWTKAKKIRFCRMAWQLGWAIGLQDGFVHIDRRIDIGLPKIVFLYSGAWTNKFGEKEITEKFNPML